MNKSDIELLSNDKIPESIRAVLATTLFTAENSSVEHDLETERIKLEQRRIVWNTPLVAALAGFLTLGATFVFDRWAGRDETTNMITLEEFRTEIRESEARLKQELERDFVLTEAELEAAAREAEFQYEILKSELANDSKTTAERAAVLLFLARAGILKSLEVEELIAMANDQIENPDQDIIPRLTNSNSSPNIRGALFGAGSVLSYAFMKPPSSKERSMIVDAMSEWQKHANLRFEEVKDQSEATIRIGVDPSKGAWSYVAQDALNVPHSSPTINLGINFNSADAKDQILATLGHVIGFPNEVSNPRNGIEWNETAVYESYAGSMSKEAIFHNFLRKASLASYPCSREFDPNSIMMIRVPAGLALDGNAIEPTPGLSKSDIECAREMYPF